jgi:ribonuclease PH
MRQRQPQNRDALEIRPLTIEIEPNRYAEGSALIRAGNTHVLCTASVEETVPNWMIGKGRGWVTGEYSMLPRSTHTRSKRDRDKVSGRTHEIQRLIGRALRSVVDLSKIGERSIIVDCDVLQADGGTRTASITGGCIALTLALRKLIAAGKAPASAITDTVAAISVGLLNNEVLVDLDYSEDSECDVDMNFVFTGKGQFIEVQGTGEKSTFNFDQLKAMTEAALGAATQIKAIQERILKRWGLVCRCGF